MDYTKPFQSFFPYDKLSGGGLSVSLADVKTHLRLDPTDTSQDTYLTLLINAATAYCQEYTRRILIKTEFETYRTFFSNTIELRRSPSSSLVSFQYLVDGTLTAVDSSLYYTTRDKDYTKIVLNNDSSYPTNGDEVIDMIKVIFFAGYADNAAALLVSHPSLYLAILNHIAALYENRGDCDLSSSSTTNLPATTRMLYDSLRIIETV